MKSTVAVRFISVTSRLGVSIGPVTLSLEPGQKDRPGSSSEQRPPVRYLAPLLAACAAYEPATVHQPSAGEEGYRRRQLPKPRTAAARRVLSDLQWLMMKDNLRQDAFLTTSHCASPYRRRLVHAYCELTGRSLREVTLSRDVGEGDLKMRRVVVPRGKRGGTTPGRDGPASASSEGGDGVALIPSVVVRAAVEGSVLLLDGIERVERNVLPALNNLLENREMDLPGGKRLIRRRTTDQRGALHDLDRHSSSAAAQQLLYAHPNFRVVALGLPVPPFPGFALDPPLRSRFQFRNMDDPLVSAYLATRDQPGSEEGADELSEALQALLLQSPSRANDDLGCRGNKCRTASGKMAFILRQFDRTLRDVFTSPPAHPRSTAMFGDSLMEAATRAAATARGRLDTEEGENHLKTSLTGCLRHLPLFSKVHGLPVRSLGSLFPPLASSEATPLLRLIDKIDDVRSTNAPSTASEAPRSDEWTHGSFVRSWTTAAAVPPVRESEGDRALPTWQNRFPEVPFARWTQIGSRVRGFDRLHKDVASASMVLAHLLTSRDSGETASDSLCNVLGDAPTRSPPRGWPADVCLLGAPCSGKTSAVMMALELMRASTVSVDGNGDERRRRRPGNPTSPSHAAIQRPVSVLTCFKDLTAADFVMRRLLLPRDDGHTSSTSGSLSSAAFGRPCAESTSLMNALTMMGPGSLNTPFHDVCGPSPEAEHVRDCLVSWILAAGDLAVRADASTVLLDDQDGIDYRQVVSSTDAKAEASWLAVPHHRHRLARVAWEPSAILLAALHGRVAVVDHIHRISPSSTLCALSSLLHDRDWCVTNGARLVAWERFLDIVRQTLLQSRRLTARRVSAEESVVVVGEVVAAIKHVVLRDRVLPVHPCFQLVAVGDVVSPGALRGNPAAAADWLGLEVAGLFRGGFVELLEDAQVAQAVNCHERDGAAASVWLLDPTSRLTEGSCERKALLDAFAAINRLAAVTGSPLNARHIKLVEAASRTPSMIRLFVPQQETIADSIRRCVLYDLKSPSARAAIDSCLSPLVRTAAATCLAPSPGGGLPHFTPRIVKASELLPGDVCFVDPLHGSQATVTHYLALHASGTPGPCYPVRSPGIAKDATRIPTVTAFHPIQNQLRTAAKVLQNLFVAADVDPAAATDRSGGAALRHVLLVGSQGTGKNKVCDQLLAWLGWEREYIQLHRDTTVSALTMSMTIADGASEWVLSPLMRAVVEGTVAVIDEADKAAPSVVCALKAIVGDQMFSLPNGDQLMPSTESATAGESAGSVATGDVRSSTSSGPRLLRVHPAFRLIVLANRPGFPFQGNDFYRECGDLFSVHVMENPDHQSSLSLLAQTAPGVRRTTLQTLAAFFDDLRQQHLDSATGLTYPYSARESVAVVRHLEAFPQMGVAAALDNVFAFDGYASASVRAQLLATFARHGLPAPASLAGSTVGGTAIDLAFGVHGDDVIWLSGSTAATTFAPGRSASAASSPSPVATEPSCSPASLLTLRNVTFEVTWKVPAQNMVGPVVDERADSFTELMASLNVPSDNGDARQLSPPGKPTALIALSVDDAGARMVDHAVTRVYGLSPGGDVAARSVSRTAVVVLMTRSPNQLFLCRVTRLGSQGGSPGSGPPRSAAPAEVVADTAPAASGIIDARFMLHTEFSGSSAPFSHLFELARDAFLVVSIEAAKCYLFQVNSSYGPEERINAAPDEMISRAPIANRNDLFTVAEVLLPGTDPTGLYRGLTSMGRRFIDAAKVINVFLDNCVDADGAVPSSAAPLRSTRTTDAIRIVFQRAPPSGPPSTFVLSLKRSPPASASEGKASLPWTAVFSAVCSDLATTRAATDLILDDSRRYRRVAPIVSASLGSPCDVVVAELVDDGDNDEKGPSSRKSLPPVGGDEVPSAATNRCLVLRPTAAGCRLLSTERLLNAHLHATVPRPALVGGVMVVGEAGLPEKERREGSCLVVAWFSNGRLALFDLDLDRLTEQLRAWMAVRVPSLAAFVPTLRELTEDGKLELRCTLRLLLHRHGARELSTSLLSDPNFGDFLSLRFGDDANVDAESAGALLNGAPTDDDAAVGLPSSGAGGGGTVATVSSSNSGLGAAGGGAGGSGGGAGTGAGGQGVDLRGDGKGGYRTERNGQITVAAATRRRTTVRNDSAAASALAATPSDRLSDAQFYARCYERVAVHLGAVHSVLASLQSQEHDREWLKRQFQGELDDARLVESVLGEPDVHRSRGVPPAMDVNGSAERAKPKYLKLLIDVSASMARFNRTDGRLDRQCEAIVLLVEAVAQTAGGSLNDGPGRVAPGAQRVALEIVGHSGGSVSIPFLLQRSLHGELGGTQRGTLPRSIRMPVVDADVFAPGEVGLRSRVALIAAIKMAAARAPTGDASVAALQTAVLEARTADVCSATDERMVVLVSDANLGAYGIGGDELSRIMSDGASTSADGASNAQNGGGGGGSSNVKTHCIFLAEPVAARALQQSLPPGSSSVCFDTAALPASLKDLFQAFVYRS